MWFIGTRCKVAVLKTVNMAIPYLIQWQTVVFRTVHGVPRVYHLAITWASTIIDNCYQAFLCFRPVLLKGGRMAWFLFSIFTCEVLNIIWLFLMIMIAAMVSDNALELIAYKVNQEFQDHTGPLRRSLT
jgi:hypothetical protein